MSIFATITLTNVGNDPGPYNIYYINGSSVITPGPTNVSQSALLAGYNVVAPNGTITVRVKSVTGICQSYYLDLQLFTTTSTTTLPVTTTTTIPTSTTTTLPVTTTTSTIPVSTTTTTTLPITTTTTTEPIISTTTTSTLPIVTTTTSSTTSTTTIPPAGKIRFQVENAPGASIAGSNSGLYFTYDPGSVVPVTNGNTAVGTLTINHPGSVAFNFTNITAVDPNTKLNYYKNNVLFISRTLGVYNNPINFVGSSFNWLYTDNILFKLYVP